MSSDKISHVYFYNAIHGSPGFPDPSAFATIKVTVSPDADVNLGSNITLECQYTGVRDPSAIKVKWEYRSFGQQVGSTIWIYNGEGGRDMCLFDGDKFERVNAAHTRMHAIRLKGAELADEGTYTCVLECYSHDSIMEYSESKNRMQITIIGVYSIVIVSICISM